MSDLQPSIILLGIPPTQGSARLRNGLALARLSSTLGYYRPPFGQPVIWT